MIVRTELTDSVTGEVTVEEHEVPDPEPSPQALALADVEAASDFAELQAATVAYLALITPT